MRQFVDLICIRIYGKPMQCTQSSEVARNFELKPGEGNTNISTGGFFFVSLL